MKLTDRKGIWFNPATRVAFGTEPANSDGNYIYFPSTLEYRVYRDCCHIFGHERVVSQVPAVIFPACNTFGELKWKIDIGILKDVPSLATIDGVHPACNFDLLIEVKGQWVLQNGYKGEFLRTLMMCEQNAPSHFEKLLLWGEKRIPLTRKISVNDYKVALNYVTMLHKQG